MAVEAEETAATKRAGGVIMFIYDVVVAGRKSKAGSNRGQDVKLGTKTSPSPHLTDTSQASRFIRLMMRRYERTGLVCSVMMAPHLTQ
jgi:hypothetical protein